ncbi:MAG: 4Fe-4S dicluster domain-containing protein [Chitinivibrionales bacterium]|nr:4Fe-4S dicluster domain-containing protein [Chitinivibrionales bacterium]
MKNDARLKTVADVAAWRLCVGCGACAAACPHEAVRLKDIIDDGIRPIVDTGRCQRCGDCLRVCPGHSLSYRDLPEHGPEHVRQSPWGPVLELWEGFATDPDIRYGASSGGAATALALHSLTGEGIDAVLHTGAEQSAPLRNRTLVSSTREQLLQRMGSRYAPASPCEGLREVLRSGRTYVFVGKPCDLHALRKAQALHPELKVRVPVAISIFCAGIPATRATMDLLASRGMAPDSLDAFRYRGYGWPGNAAVRRSGATAFTDLATYEECWDFLQKYRPYRCHLCPDGTGEFADIACGDAWHRAGEPESSPGLSLVVVRTSRGRAVVRQAMESGVLQLAKAPADALERSQMNLRLKRGAVAGRCMAFRALGLPAPRFDGFRLGPLWWRLPMAERLRSTVGTVRRVVSRRYYRPIAPQ